MPTVFEPHFSWCSRLHDAGEDCTKELYDGAGGSDQDVALWGKLGCWLELSIGAGQYTAEQVTALDEVLAVYSSTLAASYANDVAPFEESLDGRPEHFSWCVGGHAADLRCVLSIISAAGLVISLDGEPGYEVTIDVEMPNPAGGKATTHAIDASTAAMLTTMLPGLAALMAESQRDEVDSLDEAWGHWKGPVPQEAHLIASDGSMGALWLFHDPAGDITDPGGFFYFWDHEGGVGTGYQWASGEVVEDWAGGNYFQPAQAQAIAAAFTEALASAAEYTVEQR